MKFSKYLRMYYTTHCPLPDRGVKCHFIEIYEAAKKYLPTLPDPEKVEYESFNPGRDGVFGYVRKTGDPETPYVISFRNLPPSLTTFYHEIIHLAQLEGGREVSEIEAWNYPSFLNYAIQHNLPPFDLLKLSELTIKDVEEVLQSLKVGINTIDDYLWQVGTFPPAGWDEMGEKDKLTFFLAEVSAGLDAHETLAVLFFLKLIEMKLKGGQKT